MPNQQWLVTPTTYQDVLSGGPVVADPKPLDKVFALARPGETIDVASGQYVHASLRGLPRGAGAWPIKFRGAGAWQITSLLPDTAVGGSSSLLVNSRQGEKSGDVTFNRFWVKADDRSGVFTEMGGVQNFQFLNGGILGDFDPTNPMWAGPKSKWGLRIYDFGNWLLQNVKGGCISEEHFFYGEALAGDLTMIDVSVKNCRRTLLQLVNRPPPDGTNPGRGNVLLKNVTGRNMCLEDQGGGSLIHLAGGMPQTVVTLDGCHNDMGNDSSIVYPYNQNVTGFIACKDGSPTFPGGLGELHVINCSSPVGLVNPGRGSARRSNVLVTDVGEFEMSGTTLQQGPKAFPIALEIGDSVNGLDSVGKVVLGPGNVIDGNSLGMPIRVWEAAGVRQDYSSLDRLYQAHQEWFA